MECVQGMEQFQHVDDWLVTTDVTGVLTTCWTDDQDNGAALLGWDDDPVCPGQLTASTGTGLEVHDTADAGPGLLNSPDQYELSDSLPDIFEALPFDIKNMGGGRAAAPAFADNDTLAAQFCNVLLDFSQLQEINIADTELESLRTTDEPEGMVAAEADQWKQVGMADSSEAESMPCGVKRWDISEQNATRIAGVLNDLDDGSSEADDDRADVTWSYRTQKQPRRRVRRRAKSSRRSAKNVDDNRKKEQNKSAATRYREKKRSEEIQNEVECAQLERKNAQLQKRVHDLTQEVTVMRQLVVDVFKSVHSDHE